MTRSSYRSGMINPTSATIGHYATVISSKTWPQKENLIDRSQTSEAHAVVTQTELRRCRCSASPLSAVRLLAPSSHSSHSNNEI